MAGKLRPLPTSSPGIRGLNTQNESNDLDFKWASKLDNAVFDEEGNVASRKGNIKVTAGNLAGNEQVKTLHTYIKANGAEEILFSTDTKIYTDPQVPVDITGGVVGGQWQFQNFNNKVISAQQGQALAVYAGTDFQEIVSTDAPPVVIPRGNTVLTAYGRVWAMDETGRKLQWSNLLNETQFDTGTAGALDLNAVWTEGVDIVTALAAFNGSLIIFSQNNILIYSGADTNPSSDLRLTEEIENIGCIARDSVQHTGEDIIFLSKSGIRALSRVVQEKSNPTGDESANIRDEIVREVRADDTFNIKSAFSEDLGLYLLLLPTSGTIYTFDYKRRLENGSRRAARWTGMKPEAIAVSTEDELYFGKEGYVTRYFGYLDEGSTYQLSYESPWSRYDEEETLYILKKLRILFKTKGNAKSIVKWAMDYKIPFKTQNKLYTPNINISEYEIDEYNIAEYGGLSELIDEFRVPASKQGRVVKIGVDLEVNGSEVSLKRITMYVKRGRIV